MLDGTLKTKLTKIYNNGKGNPLDADSFFSDLNIVPGRVWNVSSGKAIQPYERLEKYETILKEIYSWNRELYFFIHKGTPYYFSGILSFDINEYDRAIFYFDAGLSEDFKNKIDWKTNCAAYHFYVLDDSYTNEIVQNPVHRIKKTIEPLIEEYNKTSSGKKSQFTLTNFVNNFADIKIKEKEYRSVIPSLYIFISEIEQRQLELELRSNYGGSIDPFIFHLIKGGLIFETLLRNIYSSHSSTEGLGQILNDPFVKDDLDYCKAGRKDLISYTSGVRKTLPDILNHLLPYLRKVNPVDRWFTITYSLRNVTAHSLAWPDVLNKQNYEELYKCIVFSIFYLISRKFKSKF
jgi:hypothetical protein